MAEQIIDGRHTTSQEAGYIAPCDPTVARHLDWYKGLKLGFMMHWAPVTQLGLMESWPLSDGDGHWSQTGIRWTADMDEFRSQYLQLNRTFNPIAFRPDHWARIARECGFRYLLFTTKHHDGFCMYDSQYTDYKITAPDCPFHSHHHADVTAALFDAFRAEGLGIGAYFSKPDWHSPDFWVPEFGTAPSRNANYDPLEHPERWERFVRFTHNQITELMTNYGPIDCLWLDGGWVRPDTNHQDVRIGELADRLRATVQPQLIVVDRTVPGEYENILTPEQEVPAEPIDVPWETCMSLGRSFSFHYDDVVKSPEEVIHTLCEILAKGGSLALNITPQPNGELPSRGVAVLRELGDWLRHHGEAVYESGISPCRSRDVLYTRRAGHDYAFILYRGWPVMPPRLVLEADGAVASVTSLRTGQSISFVQNDAKLELTTDSLDMVGARYADVFRICYCQADRPTAARRQVR